MTVVAGVAGGEPPALIERINRVDYAGIVRSRVAGGEPPALIERNNSTPANSPSSSVAGGEPPALIERSSTSHSAARRWSQVSPGVNPRPSLNAGRLASIAGRSHESVAGGEPPALIERSRSWTR